MPAYLMLMDGMVEGWPDNDRLLLAAARTYSSFASAFVTEDDPAFRDVLLSRSKTYACGPWNSAAWKGRSPRRLTGLKRP